MRREDDSNNCARERRFKESSGEKTINRARETRFEKPKGRNQINPAQRNQSKEPVKNPFPTETLLLTTHSSQSLSLPNPFRPLQKKATVSATPVFGCVDVMKAVVMPKLETAGRRTRAERRTIEPKAQHLQYSSSGHTPPLPEQNSPLASRHHP